MLSWIVFCSSSFIASSSSRIMGLKLVIFNHSPNECTSLFSKLSGFPISRVSSGVLIIFGISTWITSASGTTGMTLASNNAGSNIGSLSCMCCFKASSIITLLWIEISSISLTSISFMCATFCFICWDISFCRNSSEVIKLLTLLEDHEDIQKVYSNLEIEDIVWKL